MLLISGEHTMEIYLMRTANYNYVIMLALDSTSQPSGVYFWNNGFDRFDRHAILIQHFVILKVSPQIERK